MALGAQSQHGMTVAPHAAAAESGAQILAEGGNAIEACIAMAGTLSAVYPHMTGLGGDSFWLVHQPGDAVQVLMGVGRSAQAVSAQSYRAQGLSQIPVRGGRAALTVAGSVSALAEAFSLSQAHWQGRLPLQRLWADAVDYCRNGYTVTPSQAGATQKQWPKLFSQAGFAPVFLASGKAPQAGQIMQQTRLAETLEHLAQVGLEDFYNGELAQSIADDLAFAASPISLGDLQQQRAIVSTPISLQRENVQIFTTPPPTQGAATLLLLDLFARRPSGMATEENPDFIHWLVEATKRVYAGPRQAIRDPALMPEWEQHLLDQAWLEQQRIDPAEASPWPWRSEPGDTTWFGAIDREGRSVSCIQSIYHEFGSGIVLPQSGLCWHNRGLSFSLQAGHARELQPGALPFHTLCPSMAHFDDGRRMVFGTMGGDGQPQTQAALFTRYAEFKQPLAQSIAAPRWLLGRAWGDSSDSLKLESRFDPAWVATLKQRGHECELVADFDELMGHAGAIVRTAEGRLEGASDPRSDGAAVGVKG